MALTSEEWLKRLLLHWQRVVPDRRKMVELYESTQPREDPVPQYASAYKRILRMARSPWARLVVDLTEERIKVQGFSTGQDDDEANVLLWELFRRNHMDAMQSTVHREALMMGTGYTSVWPEESDSTQPRIRAESALEVVHETTPGDPDGTAAALKVWLDTIEGFVRANVYLEDRVVRFSTQIPREQILTYDFSSEAFVHSSSWNIVSEVGHDLGMVPITPFPTRPNYQGYGRSDLRDLTEILERLEYLTSNTLLAVELGALRQKWATGLEVPKDPETGNPIEPFKVALDRLWVSEDPETKFGAFPATDIGPYLKAISDAVGQLSAVSRIPPTYFVQTDLSNPPSAASLEASETGLIAKVHGRQESYGEGWERTARLVMGVATGEVPEDYLANLTVLWTDPRTRSDAQVADAAIKRQQAGVPWKHNMVFLGYSPDEIKAMEEERAADTFQRLLEGSLLGAPAPGINPQQQPQPTAAPPTNG